MTVLALILDIFPALQIATVKSAWYTDPIIVGLAIIAIFVVIDLALFARSGQRHRPQILS